MRFTVSHRSSVFGSYYSPFQKRSESIIIIMLNIKLLCGFEHINYNIIRFYNFNYYFYQWKTDSYRFVHVCLHRLSGLKNWGSQHIYYRHVWSLIIYNMHICQIIAVSSFRRIVAIQFVCFDSNSIFNGQPKRSITIIIILNALFLFIQHSSQYSIW